MWLLDFINFWNIYLLILINFAIYNNAKVHFKSTNLLCEPSPKYFHNSSCRLKAVNRYKAEAFMETYINNKLTNVSANVALYAINDANKYYPFLVNLDNKVSGLYVNNLMRSLKKYTNVNHSCPFTGHVIANNIYADAEFIPLPPLPQNSYKVVFILYEGYAVDYIGTVKYYIDVIHTKY